MKTKSISLFGVRPAIMAVSLVFLSAGGRVLAAGGAATMDNQAMANEATVVDRISASFSSFAGSDDNALSLVLGLRYGSDVSLDTITTDPDTNTSTTTTTTFTPATGAMGYGNVCIALALAEASLVNAGVTSPTAEDIEASLNGGTVTTGTGDTATTVDLAGVLTLRADGLGWGQIAHQIGAKLGPVMSRLNREANALKKAGKQHVH